MMTVIRAMRPIVALMLFSSTAASALDVDLGTLGPPVTAFSNTFVRNGNDSGTPLGPYADNYLFTLAESATVLGDLIVTEGGRTQLSAALQLTGGNIVDPLIDDTLGTFSFPDLTPGSYTLVVHGTFAGVSGVSRYLGRISAGGTLPGVPEPTMWLLLLTGFGALGAVARARLPRTAAYR